MHTQLDVDSSHQILELIKLDDLTEKASPIKVFRNVIFKYFRDTYNLSVYFVDSDSSVEDYCVDVTVDFLISYDINDKIVAFHVQEVSKLLSYSDILIVSLVYSTLPTRFLKTEMEDIKVGTDNVGILFVYHFTVPAIIAEELTSEEKENHKKKSKEKSERLLNWSKSIIRKYNM
ncbi:unnamed protein product [Rhizophagus irregularis]|nr:unnamed protein product [Rhizophagus irregularis]